MPPIFMYYVEQSLFFENKYLTLQPNYIKGQDRYMFLMVLESYLRLYHISVLCGRKVNNIKARPCKNGRAYINSIKVRFKVKNISFIFSYLY